MIRQIFRIATAGAAMLCVAKAAAAVPEPGFDTQRLQAVIAASGLSGDVLVGEGATPLFVHRGALWEKPARGADAQNWRWASVTKQVVSVLVMQEVEAGRLALDETVARYLPGFRSPNAGRITVRQLLQHRSGLPNPDDTSAEPGQMPAYYRASYRSDRGALIGYCAGAPKAEPGGAWTYNNCDYLVLGALLEKVSGKSWDRLVRDRISRPLGLKTLAAFPTRKWVRPGRVAGVREPEIHLAAYGAAGGLYGSPSDLLAFNAALMTGRLLKPETLATLWKGDPALGFMALGQWVFDARLAGCAEPVRLVERRGAIAGVGLRNFIVPDRKMSLIILSDKGEFDFGEVWQGRGPSHDMLSAALCPKGAG